MNHLIARGICIQDDKILLAYFPKHQYYFLPGGHIEPRESGKETLIRECREEMGVEVSSCSYISTLENAYESEGETQHEIALLYTFQVPEGEITSREAHLEFKWVAKEEFKNLKFLPQPLKAQLENLMEGKEFPKFISTF